MDETQLLFSRIEDLIWENECGSGSFLGFLNEREAAAASAYLNNRGVDYRLYGGYKNASRVYISFSPDTPDCDFPISALRVSSKGSRTLSHRDFLGALMGLGVKRECVGDIVMISDTEAVIFVRSELAEFIIRELDKVGRDSVEARTFTSDRDELCSKTETLRLIVTSMRIDNVVSACAGCSRSDASELISSDMVFVNYLNADKPSRLVSEGDVLSIRGHGKFIIGDLAGKTKKDRLVINVLHYI